MLITVLSTVINWLTVNAHTWCVCVCVCVCECDSVVSSSLWPCGLRTECCLCVCSVAQLYLTLCQAPLSMRPLRQEYWVGLPFPSLEDLPNPGVEPGLLQILYDLNHQESPPPWHFCPTCYLDFVGFVFWLPAVSDVFLPFTLFLSESRTPVLLWSPWIHVYPDLGSSERVPFLCFSLNLGKK